MSATKPLSISLTEEDRENLDFLVDYFQKESISTVTKTDVIKFILKQTRAMVELDKIDEFREELEKEARAGGVEL